MTTLSGLRFKSVSVRSLRNIASLELEPGPGLNVVFGDNGQGKTSLLEAIYLAATSKSFRSEKLGALVREGDERAVVRAVIEEDGFGREQKVSLGRRGSPSARGRNRLLRSPP